MRRLHQVTAIMPEYFLSNQANYLQKALSFRHRIFQISRCRCNNINHLRQKIGVYCRTWVLDKGFKAVIVDEDESSVITAYNLK